MFIEYKLRLERHAYGNIKNRGDVMAKGSFEGLYTFLEVSEIYGIDDSCLRKQVARDKYVIGVDVKKMGRTWIITEQAMLKTFGDLKFKEYKQRLEKESKIETKMKKAKRQKTKAKDKKEITLNSEESKVKDSWVEDDVKGVELKSFSFD